LKVNVCYECKQPNLFAAAPSEAALEHDGLRVSRAEFERNLQDKLGDKTFLSDIEPLHGELMI